MKKRIYFLSMLFIVASLSACGSKNYDSNKKTEENKEVEQDNNPNYKDKYAIIFDDFNNLFSNKGNRHNITLNIPLHSWTVDSIVNSSEKLKYSFYDINNDGTDEMLVSNDSGTGKLYLLAAYYLKDNKPTLIGESYVGSSGGARQFTTLYKDERILIDAWSSGSGNGIATSYKLSKDNGELQQIASKNYEKKQYQLSDLGITESEELDLSTINWEKFEDNNSNNDDSKENNNTKEQSTDRKGMNLTAIANGDFSSVVGKWQNGLGATLEFNHTGMVRDYTISRLEFKDNLLQGGVQPVNSPVGGAVILFIPAGVTIPHIDYGDNGGIIYDSSDKSRDRLLVTQYIGAIEIPEEFYYLVE